MVERVECRVCGRLYRPVIPKGGDGSVEFPAKHRAIGGGGDYCEGSFEAPRDPRTKFGYEHAEFMREMHERLCEARGLDPVDFHAQVYFDSSWAWGELRRREPTYRQRQEAAAAARPPREPRPQLTVEELAYLADKLQMVNDPLGQSILDKLAKMLERA